MITYGAKGINSLEHYDCVFAVMPYYVHPSAIVQVAFLGEIYSDEESITPCFTDTDYRYKVTSAEHQYLQPAVDAFQDLLELDLVNQAISRIRPFTQPREVVLCGGQDFGRFLGIPVTRFKNERVLFNHIGIPTHSTHFEHATRWVLSQRLKVISDDQIAADKLAELGAPDENTAKYINSHFKQHLTYWKAYFEASLGYFYQDEVDWAKLL